MTYIFDPELKIAAGFNNADELVSVNSIIAPGDTRPFVAPMAWYNFSPGTFKICLDQTRYISGKPNTAFEFTFLTKNQWLYLSDTYCGSGYTGEITIRTKTRDYSAPANYNAIMYLPSPAETLPKLGRIGTPVKVPFVSLGAI